MPSSYPLAIKSLSGLTLGDHVGYFCSNPEQWRTHIQSFFWEGVQENHHCLYLNDLFTRDQVFALLRSRNLDAHALQQEGQITILPVTWFWKKTGWPDMEVLGQRLSHFCRLCQGRGFEALRLMVDMSWAATSQLHEELLMAFEDLINQVLLPRQFLLVVCQFDRALFSPRLLSLVKQKHPLLVDSAEGFSSDRKAPGWIPGIAAGEFHGAVMRG